MGCNENIEAGMCICMFKEIHLEICTCVSDILLRDQTHVQVNRYRNTYKLKSIIRIMHNIYILIQIYIFIYIPVLQQKNFLQ